MPRTASIKRSAVNVSGNILPVCIKRKSLETPDNMLSTLRTQVMSSAQEKVVLPQGHSR